MHASLHWNLHDPNNCSLSLRISEFVADFCEYQFRPHAPIVFTLSLMQIKFSFPSYNIKSQNPRLVHEIDKKTTRRSDNAESACVLRSAFDYKHK